MAAVLLFVVVLAPFLLLLISALERNLIELLTHQQASSVRFIARDIEQKIQLRLVALEDVANQIQSEQMNDGNEMSRYLKKRVAIYRFFPNGVNVIDRHGLGVADEPQLEGRGQADFRDQEYFQEVMRSGRPAIGAPRVGRFTKTPGVGIAVPIKNHRGQPIGVLAGFLSLTDPTIFDQANARIGQTGHYSLISSQHRVIIADADSRHLLRSLDEFAPGALTELIFDGINTSKVGIDMLARPALLSDTHILDGHWVLIGALPTAEAFAPIVQLKTQVYWAALAVLLVFSSLMWWVMHKQLGIVTRATRSLQKMAGADPTLHALHVDRDDELGGLIHAFNALQLQIEEKDGALNRSKRRFENLFEHMSNGFALHAMIFDERGKPVDYRFLEINPAFEHLTGLVASAVIGKTVRQVIPGLASHWISKYGDVVLSGKAITFEDHAQAIDRWYKVIAYRPEPGKFAVVIEDVTELKQALTELSHRAHHDALTGLPNRVLFADRLELAIVQARRRQTLLAVGYIDLDDFKPVNDNYGHAAGDQLLIDVAARLKQALRAGDSVARLGGDEFALLLTDMTDETAIHDLLARLLCTVAAPYCVASHGIVISMSMGVTIYPSDDVDADLLMRHADEALYMAKNSGRNRYCCFPPG